MQPVAAPAVSPELMRAPRPPRCDPPPAATYPAEQVGDALECWRNAHTAVSRRLSGLQKAIAVREDAVSKAVTASATGSQ